MNYIGSKQSLLNFLGESISKIVKSGNTSFCDLFAGTGAVGVHFKKLGYKIISNDLQYYSFVLNRHYIANRKELEFNGLFKIVENLEKLKVFDRKNAVCNYLNILEGIEGFITKEYCPDITGAGRLYFNPENGKRCDAIRIKIEEWKKIGAINEDEYFFLLTCLLEAADKVANTASVYGAFLKSYKKTAQKPLDFKASPLYISDNQHTVFNEDANKLIAKIETDILYLDPPYNERQYSANYHVLETIARYDNPPLKGKTGLRNYSGQKSKYCSKNMIKSEFTNLIENAKAKYIFLSYNNEGNLSFEDIKKIMESKGEYGCFTKSYNRFKADSKRVYSADKTLEYLHYCIVKK